MVYRSKIGKELVVILIVAMLPAIITSQTGVDANPVTAGILIGAAILVACLLVTTRYKVDNDLLKISVLFIPYKPIDIKTITKIEETYNPLSAPAASIDRLGITHGRGYMLVSPVNKSAFIAHLKQVNPHIEVVLRKK